jgi:hypothetical protein
MLDNSTIAEDLSPARNTSGTLFHFRVHSHHFFRPNVLCQIFEMQRDARVFAYVTGLVHDELESPSSSGTCHDSDAINVSPLPEWSNSGSSLRRMAAERVGIEFVYTRKVWLTGENTSKGLFVHASIVSRCALLCC